MEPFEMQVNMKLNVWTCHGNQRHWKWQILWNCEDIVIPGIIYQLSDKQDGSNWLYSSVASVSLYNNNNNISNWSMQPAFQNISLV